MGLVFSWDNYRKDLEEIPERKEKVIEALCKEYDRLAWLDYSTDTTAMGLCDMHNFVQNLRG